MFLMLNCACSRGIDQISSVRHKGPKGGRVVIVGGYVKPRLTKGMWGVHCNAHYSKLAKQFKYSSRTVRSYRKGNTPSLVRFPAVTSSLAPHPRSGAEEERSNCAEKGGASKEVSKVLQTEQEAIRND